MKMIYYPQHAAFIKKIYIFQNEHKNKVNEYLSNIQLEYSLNDREKTELDNTPSLSECTEAVSNMMKDKSPGSDGLSCKFYQTVLNDRKHFLLLHSRRNYFKKYDDIPTKVIFNYPDIKTQRPSISQKL
jgi:hypothetical protein